MGGCGAVQEALLRAVRENPALAEQYPQLGKVLDKGRAAEEKERGNQAFAAQRCVPHCCCPMDDCLEEVD